jgi:hypothetical protein
MKTCGTAILNSNETSPRKAGRILASCSRANFGASKEDYGCFCCLDSELLFGCDRFDNCCRHDPAVDSLALAASSNRLSALQEHLSAVIYMQCYNITFFLRLPLLHAREQGASQGSCDPTVPRRSHEKPGLLFLSAGGGRLLRRNQVTFKPWPVRPPAPVVGSLKGSAGATGGSNVD